MYRITEQLSQVFDAQAIVNGENVGQVASQTLESMATIEAVVKIPVIRPLATFDKQDIVDIAKRIDTYDISIRPYEDCCTVFVPRHPQIKPQIKQAEIEESKFEFIKMINQAVNDTKTFVIKSNEHIDCILYHQDKQIKIDNELF